MKRHFSYCIMLIFFFMIVGCKKQRDDKIIPDDPHEIEVSRIDETSLKLLQEAVDISNAALQNLGQKIKNNKKINYTYFDIETCEHKQKEIPEKHLIVLKHMAEHWRLELRPNEGIFIVKQFGDKKISEKYKLGLDTALMKSARTFLKSARAVERKYGADFASEKVPANIIKQFKLSDEAVNSLFLALWHYRISSTSYKNMSESYKKKAKKLVEEKLEIDNLNSETMKQHLSNLEKLSKYYTGNSKRYIAKSEEMKNITKLFCSRRYTANEIASLLLHEMVHKRQFEINNTVSYAIKYASNYLFKSGYYNIDAERQAFLIQSIYDMEMPEESSDEKIITFTNKDLNNEK